MGRLTKEQIEFIKQNIEKLTNKEMAEILGCNTSTISNWRKKLNISFSDLHNFHQYDQYIIDNYYTKTSTKLAQEIGCSKEYIKKIWADADLKGKTKRQYYCNFNFFDKIDTPNKAYILGVICSDGCIYKRDNHEGLWQVSVDKKDKAWLEQIKKVIKSNNPINEGKSTVTLTIVNQHMYEILCSYGIIPRKTYTMNIQNVFNIIPKEFWMDFIHGYFDGDGSITLKEIPSKSCIQFAVPERFIESFQNALSYYNIKTSVSTDNRFEKYTIPFSNLRIEGANNKFCLLKLFFLHNTISLERKSDLCKKLCQLIQSNITNRKENITAVLKWEELLESLRR